MPPSLTVKAFAEMIELPSYEHLRILEEQKYPDQAPASFRVPFYQPALSAIREFYRSGGQVQILSNAIAKIQTSGMVKSRKKNNLRVIRSFQRSKQRRRQLSVLPTQRVKAMFTGVELKYTPDLAATENQINKYILYNFRQTPITDDVARATLELAHWVLIAAGVSVGLSDLEYIDLAKQAKLYRIHRIRQLTMKHAHGTARAIVPIWQGI